VLKFSAEDVRWSRIYERLGNSEPTDLTPSIILGSKKTAKSREWPFAFAFLELQRRILEARTVVVAGYSFRDASVNQRLSAGASSGQRRWIVVNRKSEAEWSTFRRDVQDVLGNCEIEYVLNGFGAPMPRYQ
jgi:hypothetical protein